MTLKTHISLGFTATDFFNKSDKVDHVGGSIVGLRRWRTFPSGSGLRLTVTGGTWVAAGKGKLPSTGRTGERGGSCWGRFWPTPAGFAMRPEQSLGQDS